MPRVPGKGVNCAAQDQGQAQFLWQSPLPRASRGWLGAHGARDEGQRARKRNENGRRTPKLAWKGTKGERSGMVAKHEAAGEGGQKRRP